MNPRGGPCRPKVPLLHKQHVGVPPLVRSLGGITANRACAALYTKSTAQVVGYHRRDGRRSVRVLANRDMVLRSRVTRESHLWEKEEDEPTPSPVIVQQELWREER